MPPSTHNPQRKGIPLSQFAAPVNPMTLPPVFENSQLILGNAGPGIAEVDAIEWMAGFQPDFDTALACFTQGSQAILQQIEEDVAHQQIRAEEDEVAVRLPDDLLPVGSLEGIAVE